MPQRSHTEKNMQITNRSRLKVTTKMLDAGLDALQLCREVDGHTPRTICQAVFTAMLAESEWSPAIRKRPAAKLRSRSLQEPARSPEHYRGQRIGVYEWYGFNREDGRHYLRDSSAFPHRWIRVTDKQWQSETLQRDIDRGYYYVNSGTAFQYMKRKHLTIS